MNTHVLFLGGTGARTYRALVHCLASGMYQELMPKYLEFHSYLIDSDVANGDGARSRHIAQYYQEIQIKTQSHLNSPSDCPLFSIPLHETDISLPSLKTNIFANLEKDSQLFLSSLLGDIKSNTKSEMGTYLAVLAADLTPLMKDLDPYRDLVIIVGGTFGTTGYEGMAELACRIRQIHSKCRVAIIPVGPYFKLNTPKYGSVYSETFFTRHSLLKYFYNRVLKRGLSQIAVYDVCLSDREVDALNYAEGGAKQKNPSHIVELFATSAIFELIKMTWAEGEKMEFDMRAIKAGHDIGLNVFPNEMRKQIDRLLCFSIWCRHFAQRTYSAPKEIRRFADDFCVWLEEMKQQTISFDPINFSNKEMSQSFKWYKPSVQFGLFCSDPLSSKNLDNGFKKAMRSMPNPLSEDRGIIAAQYKACNDAWKQFISICNPIS